VINERTGTIVLSALAAHTGWHWMLERAARLSQFRLEWPDIMASTPAYAIYWLVLIVTLAALLPSLPRLRRIKFPFSLEAIAPRNHLQSKKRGGEI
jgi:hypothetical protein